MFIDSNMTTVTKENIKTHFDQFTIYLYIYIYTTKRLNKTFPKW